MLLPELWELFEYWQEYPPVHIILAARYLERRSENEPSGSEVGVLNSLARQGSVMSSATLPLAVQGAIEQMKRQNG